MKFFTKTFLNCVNINISVDLPVGLDFEEIAMTEVLVVVIERIEEGPAISPGLDTF